MRKYKIFVLAAALAHGACAQQMAEPTRKATEIERIALNNALGGSGPCYRKVSEAYPDKDMNFAADACECVRKYFVANIDDRLAIFIAANPKTALIGDAAAPPWAERLIPTIDIVAAEGKRACNVSY